MAKATGAKTRKRDAENADRFAEAYKLGIQGLTFEEIAAKLGFFDKSGARKAFIKGREMRREDRMTTIDEETHAMNHRFDELVAPLWERHRNGDTEAGNLILKTEAKRMELLGLAAPKRTEITARVDASTEVTTADAKREIGELFGQAVKVPTK